MEWNTHKNRGSMKNKKTFNRRTYANGLKPEVTTRELPPRVQRLEKGMQLMCPFCVPPHPIVPGQESQCGTTIRVSAVQTLIPLRTVRDKKLVCMKCKETGKGPMARFGNGFIHAEDCKPGTMVMTEHPPFSKLAERVYKMKDGLAKKFLIGRFGEPQETRETATDKVAGYFFLKA